METWNKRLFAAGLVLLGLSAFTYWDEISRADRFERGQKLLQSVDPDEIASIVLETADGDGGVAADAASEESAGGADQGAASLTLTRQGDGFVVREVGGYRARNDAINRLIKALLDIELRKQLGRGTELAREIGLGEGAADRTVVALRNSSGEDMVRLALAPAEEADGASYVQRLDGDNDQIYLTTTQVFLDTSAKDFLDRELVEHPASDIVRIAGADFLIERNEESNQLEMVEPAGREAKASEVSRLSSLLNRLRFAEVYRADAPQVANLAFDERLRFELADQSGYVLQVAEEEGTTFLRISATYGVDRLEITREETDEELKEKSEVLKRSDEVVQFNAFHGSWVYELEAFDAEKLALDAEALVDDAS